MYEVYVDLENRGAEVRGIQLNYSGPGEFTISPNAVLESNSTCNLILMITVQRHQPTQFGSASTALT